MSSRFLNGADLNGQKLTSVGIPSSATDGVPKGYVDALLSAVTLVDQNGNALTGQKIQFVVNTVTGSVDDIIAVASADTTAPTTPGTPTATVNGSSVGLAWTGSSDNVAVTGYRVYRSDNPSSVLATTSSTSYTDTPLVNTAYTYTVAAYDAAGNVSPKSAASNSVTITPTAPAAPTNLTGSPGNGQVTLSWLAPTNTGGSAITDYLLQYSSDSGTTWNTFTHTASTATSQIVTGLTNGTAYVGRVAAVNAVGTGPYSTTSAPATPAVPSGNFVSDSFTDTSGTLLSSHVGETGAAWIRNNSGNANGMVRIASNALMQTTADSAGTGFYLASGIPASANYTVEADIIPATLVAGDSAGIMLRAVPDSITDYEFRYSVNAGTWAIVKRVAATATVLVSFTATLTPGSTYHAKFTAAGNTLTGYVNGTQVVTITDTSITAAGSPGLLMNTVTPGASSATNLMIDNYIAHP